MRIRKRQVPFPLSSLTPVPLSDPLLRQTPAVQLHGHDGRRPDDSFPHHPQPSDPLNPRVSDLLAMTIGRGSGAGEPKAKENQRCSVLQRREGGEPNRNNEFGNGSLLGLAAATTTSEVLPLFLQAGEKAVPFKKRKVSLLMEGTMKASTKEKADDSITINNMNTHDETRNEDVEYFNNGSNYSKNEKKKEKKEKKKKKKEKEEKRGGAVLEGSRCSRVNGRGWRCCQQTLVGYSLCEHHLGKGRLRAISSTVPSRPRTTPTMTAAATAAVASASKEEQKQVDDHDDDNPDNNGDAKKPMLMTMSKRRVRIGTVKARSLSSLLSQTHYNNNPVVSDNTI